MLGYWIKNSKSISTTSQRENGNYEDQALALNQNVQFAVLVLPLCPFRPSCPFLG